jgi:hypothetical protein
MATNIFRQRIGEYKYPGGYQTAVEYWYECERREQPVYLHFQCALDAHEIGLRVALDFAFEKDVYGVEIIRDPERRCQLRVCEFKPLQRHFNSDLRPIIEYEDLREVPTPHVEFPSHLRLVRVGGHLVMFKSMGERGEQCEFEAELKRYGTLKGCKQVSQFKGLVRKDGLFVGFLVTYIGGENLRTLLSIGRIKAESELLAITRQIIQVSVALEERQIFHQDLKLENIIRREADRAIYFIDFGEGLTPGMFNRARHGDIMVNGANAVDAMYILGMTLWWLWNIDYKGSWAAVEFERTRNDFVRGIIEDCIEGRCESIKELYNRHYGGRSEEMQTGLRR